MLLDYDMVHYHPSETAAAALCLSQLVLDGQKWVSLLAFSSPSFSFLPSLTWFFFFMLVTNPTTLLHI